MHTDDKLSNKPSYKNKQLWVDLQSYQLEESPNYLVLRV